MAILPLIGLVLIAAVAALFWLTQHLKPETRGWLAGGLGAVLIFVVFTSWFRLADDSPAQLSERKIVHGSGDIETRKTAIDLSDSNEMKSNAPMRTVKTEKRGNDIAMTVVPEHDHAEAADSTEKAAAKPKDDPTAEDSHGEHVHAPKWTTDPPQRIGDSYFVVVKSGSYSDPNVRDEMLDTKILAAAEKYVAEMLYRNDPDILESIHLIPATLREQCVRAQYPTDGEATTNDETFVRLEFDRKFREGVEQSRRRNLTRQRVEQSALIVAGIMTVLGAALVYLKTTKPRPGEA